MMTLAKAALDGGVNQYSAPTELKDNEWQQTQNMAPAYDKRHGQRQSLTFAREVEPRDIWNADLWIAAPTFGQYYFEWAKNIRPVKMLFTSINEFAMVCVTTQAINIELLDGAGSVYAAVPAGYMLLLSNWGAWGTVALRGRVLGPVSNVSLLQFLDEVYSFSGYDNGSRITPAVVSYGYQMFANDFGTGNATFNPQGAAVVRDRVVYFKGPNVYWSDKNDALVIGDDAESSRGINVGGEEQENITAVAELSTTADGSPVQSVAAVWTKSRMFMLLGEPIESDENPAPENNGGLGSLQINRLNVEAGCVSQSTVTRTPYGTFWAGLDDVWFMPFGQIPIRVGTKIRPVLRDQPVGLQWKLHAEYSDGFYRLAVFAPGQGPNDYSPCQHQWWLDLTDGPPNNADEAVWYGPQVISNTFDNPDSLGGTYTMARDLRATGDGRLYTLQPYLMPGNNATVYGMSLCSFDGVVGRDTSAPTGEPDEWLPSTAIDKGNVFRPVTGKDNFTTPTFICTTAGITGLTEPNWLAPSATGTVTDGTVTWTLRYFDSVGPDEALPGYKADISRLSDEVEMSLLSKEFDFGDPMTDKLLDGAELGFYAGDNTRVTYTSHPDQETNSRVLYPTRFGNINQLGAFRGENRWDSRLLTTPYGTRFNAKTAALSLTQDAGYVIKTGFNDTFTLTNGTSVPFVATIAAGYYATIADVITAILAALNAYSVSISSTATFVNTYADDGDVFRRALIGWLAADSGGPMVLRADPTERLAQIIGFSASLQGSAPDNSANPTQYLFGAVSPRRTLCPELQLSGINLRAAAFGRRPL